MRLLVRHVLWIGLISGLSCSVNAQTLDQALAQLPLIQQEVVNAHQEITFDAFLNRLSDKRVVYVGEYHPRYQDHLLQLAVIQAMHQQHPQMAIGMEWFQAPFQPWLDAYVMQLIDEQTLLDKTEYYQRWRIDFRQLRPILAYARAHGIRLLALNAPSELTRQISTLGRDSLAQIQRQTLPTITPPSDEQRQRLLKVFEGKIPPNRAIEDYIYAQRVWDEVMADNALAYLSAHPQARLVVLAGNFHIAWGDAIPADMRRRAPALNGKQATVSSGSFAEYRADFVDYFVYTDPIQLPATGKLGVRLNANLCVQSIESDSAAELAGLQIGDRILSLNQQTLQSLGGFFLALSDTRPGQTLTLDIARGKDKQSLSVTLD
ncbi:MAG: ChaN family lipoprotein [Thiomicrospira sp.]|jgi:uncharacterized iron-regulated protein|nr:ChaN family lipoprotein [Thiomicrospira sp.]